MISHATPLDTIIIETNELFCFYCTEIFRQGYTNMRIKKKKFFFNDANILTINFFFFFAFKTAVLCHDL